MAYRSVFGRELQQLKGIARTLQVLASSVLLGAGIGLVTYGASRVLVTRHIRSVTTGYVRSFLEEEAYLPTAARQASEIAPERIHVGRELLGHVANVGGAKARWSHGMRCGVIGVVLLLAGGLVLFLRALRPPGTGGSGDRAVT